MARLIDDRSSDLRWLPVVVLLVLASILPLMTPYPYLAIAPALGALALFAIGQRPQIGLYAIIFLIPFGNFRNIAGPLESIKIHWLLALILLLLLLIRLLVERGFVASLRCNLWPWFLLFLAVSLLSSFFSDDHGYVAHQVSLLLVAMLFFTLTIAMLERESVTRHIPIVIALSVSLGSLLAVLGNLTGMSGFSEGATFSRSTGGTTDPNSLALQIIFGMPFLVFWLFHARHAWSRVFAAILILINLTALVGTYSRSGTLVIGATLLILLIINSRDIRPRHLGLLIVGMTATALFGAAMLPQSFWERQASLFEQQQDRSLGRRFSYIIVARDAVIERPILGHGPGTFRNLFAQTDWAQKFHKKGATKRRYAHNTYLEVVVGTGLLGLAAFAGLLITAWRNLYQASRRLIEKGDRYHGDLVMHYLIAFSALLIFLMFFSDVFQKFMLLCLGLSQVWVRVANEQEDPSMATHASEERP